MKKAIIVLLILAVLALSACSKQNAEPVVGQGSNADEGSTQSQDSSTATPQNSDVKEFKITAKQFEFTPSTIEVNKGDKVRLIVTSTDVPHGIAIREYGINKRLEPGQPVTIEFTADKEGSFTAYCSAFCGSGHSNMKGSLIVK